MQFKASIYWNFVCSIVQRVGFVHVLICREPAVMHMTEQSGTNKLIWECYALYSTLISIVYGSL